MKIDVAKDFSNCPAGRSKKNGNFTGEHFRELLELRLPKLTQGEVLEVDFTGAEGCGSSFLDEAFAGLIKRSGMDKAYVEEKIKIIGSDPRSQLYRNVVSRKLEELERSSK